MNQTILVTLVISLFLGSGLETWYYKRKIASIESEYQQRIVEARKQEQVWKQVSEDSAKEYEQKINNITNVDSAVIDSLRKQIDDYANRVSSDTRTDRTTNESSREQELGTRVKLLIDFSSRCARQADQLEEQVTALQDWIKKTR